MKTKKYKKNKKKITTFDMEYIIKKMKKKTLKNKNLIISYYNKNIPYVDTDIIQSIPDNAYLLCVRYGIKPFDIQIGITGTALVSEDYKSTIIRELKEETGLSITKKKLNSIIKNNPSVYKKINVGKKKWKWISLCSDDLKASKSSLKRSYKKDNKNKKVGVLIWSKTKKDLEEKIKKSFKNGGLNLLLDDNIGSLLIVPKTTVLEWLKKLKNIHR